MEDVYFQSLLASYQTQPAVHQLEEGPLFRTQTCITSLFGAVTGPNMQLDGEYRMDLNMI